LYVSNKQKSIYLWVDPVMIYCSLMCDIHLVYMQDLLAIGSGARVSHDSGL